MTKKIGAVAAAVLALSLVSSSFTPAEARRGFGGWHGGHHFSGARFYGGRHFAGHFRHGHFRRNVFIGLGVPLAYGAYSYGYGGGCYWLRRRAIATGNPYWWDRYDACINGYY